jgi:hypothetical protein
MPSEIPIGKKKEVPARIALQQRRIYHLKSLMRYGFTKEQAEVLLESIEEYVEEEKDLTEEAEESLFE